MLAHGFFQFIPTQHHLGNDCCCVAPVKTQSLLESMSTGVRGGGGGWGG